MNLFAELQRRNVFKVGAAWLVGGWVLIQVAATVAPQLKLPDWLPTLVTVLVGAGFPVALVLAWFFDITPSGVHRDAQDVGRAQHEAPAHAKVAPTTPSNPPILATQPTSPAAGNAATPSIPNKSVAVLPFADLSPSHDQEYFSDGIAEEILNALVKLKDLKVAGRTSSFSFKGRSADLRDIGRTLSVAHVLEGSVRKHGDKVRITAQLIQAADGYHLWSDSYDGELADVFDLQERIARAIVHELDVILHGDDGQRLVPVATRDPEAYALYLQASVIFARRDGARFPEAIGDLRQALVRDPTFARAHARLASIHALEPIYTPESADTAPDSVRREAALASKLDPRLAEPHAAIALSCVQQHRFLDSRQAMERALALDPDDVTAGFWEGSIRINSGYVGAGCALLDHVLTLDPLYPNALLWRGTQYWYAGDVARAEVLLQRAAQAGLSHANLGLHLLSAARGRSEEAIAQLTDGLRVLGAGLPDDLPRILAHGVYGDTTARVTAIACIDAYLATQPHWLSASILYALLHMDQAARAFDLSLRHRTNNDAQYFHCLWSPALRTARALPEFHAFTRAMGMTALWDRYGPPDGCHRNADGDYVFS